MSRSNFSNIDLLLMDCRKPQKIKPIISTVVDCFELTALNSFKIYNLLNNQHLEN